ncbi:gamma-glutamyl-gamma-aminobutyrate hydrolase family protein [Kordiimonas sp.]|uniref:gamma-glutamyl-gamma-aminobutyrate hydrolase family protein n=1 Tax=Kordiimonas sp. TaxID=1970157 RepID=UPI003A8DDF00
MASETPHETRKPLIGVTTGRNANAVAYTAVTFGVWLAGGRPVRISPIHNIDMVREISGLVVTGGVDVNPRLYGEKNIASAIPEPERDALEMECLEMAFAADVPILGICRGAQLLNVARGGSLYQDVPSVFDGFLPTKSTLGKIFVRRQAEIEEGTRMADVMGRHGAFWVNSLHHQAINQLGRGLRVAAQDELGIVQGIEGSARDPFMLGVQWHPEFMLYSKAQRRIFAALIAASSPRHARSAAKEGRFGSKEQELAYYN